jgi:hypothetical protein
MEDRRCDFDNLFFLLLYLFFFISLVFVLILLTLASCPMLNLILIVFGFCIDSLDIGKLSYVKFDPHCFHCSLFIYLFILGPFFFFFIKVIQHWVHWKLDFMIFLICILWSNLCLITRVTGLEG